MPVWYPVLFGVAGAVLYTFLNPVIRRWDAKIRSREDYDADVDEKLSPAEKEKAEAEKEKEKEKCRISLSDTRKEKPVRFWVITALGAVLGVLPAVVSGVSPEAFLYFLFYGILTVIAFIDLDTMEIPPQLNLAIFVMGIAGIWLMPEITLRQRIVGTLVLSLPLFLLDLIRPDAFGFGDLKLLTAAGFFLGWKMNVTAFFVGAIVAALASVVLMLGKKKGMREHIPFGPSLCIGYVISTLVGTDLVNWYILVLKNAMGK